MLLDKQFKLFDNYKSIDSGELGRYAYKIKLDDVHITSFVVEDDGNVHLEFCFFTQRDKHPDRAVGVAGLDYPIFSVRTCLVSGINIDDVTNVSITPVVKFWEGLKVSRKSLRRIMSVDFCYGDKTVKVFCKSVKLKRILDYTDDLKEAEKMYKKSIRVITSYLE